MCVYDASHYIIADLNGGLFPSIANEEHIDLNDIIGDNE